MSGQAANDAGNGRGAGVASAIRDVSKMLESNYRQNTPTRLRLLDTFLVFLFVTGVLQAWPDGPFVYCMLVGTFPFNSFLAGFSSTVGAFVLTVSLRMQVVEASESGGVVGGRSLERCFAEYVVCNIVLFLVVMNFMG
ncbi:unnamed protein product [Ascophyllum nodosum]